MLRYSVILFVLALAALQVSAAPDAAQQKVINRALTLTGVDIALEQIDLAYLLSLEQQMPAYKLDDKQSGALREALAGFNAGAIKKLIRQHLLAEYQERPMQSVVSLQQQGVAEKLRSYERIASAPGQQEKLENYLATLDEHPVSEERLKLLRAANMATFTVTIAALVQAYADVATAVALDFVSAEYISRDDVQGVSLWRRKLEENYRDLLNKQGEGYMIFAYRFLDDEQLNDYIELWQDKNMQWFMETVVAGLRKTLREQHKQLVESLDSQIASRISIVTAPR